MISSSTSGIWNLRSGVIYVYFVSKKNRLKVRWTSKSTILKCLVLSIPRKSTSLFLIRWPNYSRSQIPDSRRRWTDQMFWIGKRLYLIIQPKCFPFTFMEFFFSFPICSRQHFLSSGKMADYVQRSMIYEDLHSTCRVCNRLVSTLGPYMV